MAHRRTSTLRNHFDWNDKLFICISHGVHRISFALASSPFCQCGKRTIIRLCQVICHAWIWYLCLLGVECYFATILFWQGDETSASMRFIDMQKINAQALIRSRMPIVFIFLFSIYSIFVRRECVSGGCGGSCFLYTWNVLHIAFNMSSFIHGSTSIPSNQANARQIHTEKKEHKRNESERTYTQFV